MKGKETPKPNKGPKYEVGGNELIVPVSFILSCIPAQCGRN